MQGALGLVAVVVSLATAVLGIWQINKQRQRDCAQQAAFAYYNALSVPAASAGHGPASTGSAHPGLATRATPLPASLRILQLWSAVRDAGFTFAATALLGVVLALGGPVTPYTVAVLDLAAVLVGFTLSALHTHGSRRRHVAVFGGTVWALSLVNVLVGLSSVGAWFAAALLIMLCGLVALAATRVLRSVNP